MKNARKGGKRVLSVLLAIIMVLSCAAASFSVVASAADWTYVDGTVYEPVTIYSEVSQPENGKTYYVAVWYYNLFINVSAGGTISNGTASIYQTQPAYYTSDDGSDVTFKTTSYYTDVMTGCEFIWNNGTLYNPVSNKYLSYSGTSTVAMNDTAFNFSYNASNHFLYSTIGARTRYLCVNNTTNNVISYSTSTSYSYTRFFEKVTVYQKASSGTKGYYRYSGPESYTLSAGQNFTTADVEKNVSVQYKSTSTSTSYQTFAIGTNEISLVWDKTFDANKAGTYIASVKVGSTVIDKITVIVSSSSAEPSNPETPEDPNANDGTPVYPAPGSVKIDKWATGEHLAETGVGEVNLSVTAIPPIYALGVDVVFVTDVSNSMAWVAGTQRAPQSGETSKLQDMQKAVGEFVDIFLARNYEGNIRGNNTVTFTTFGAWDADRTSTSYSYTDPTRTLFVANRDAESIKNQVNLLTFTMPESNTYYLTFNGSTSTSDADRNYGGTNYDVGMMEAYDAIAKVKAEYYTQTGEDYDSTGRQIQVIFITDGAPTLYNGVQYKTVSSNSPTSTMSYVNPQTGALSSYTGSTYTQSTWYDYIKNTDHAWSTKVYNTDHVRNISCIGIDFPNGGFLANTDYWIFTKQSGYPLENVLSGLVTNKTLDILLAEDQIELASYLSEIALETKDSTDGADTIDLVGTKFDIQTASTVTDSNGNVIKLSDYGITPTIKVTRYPLYHKSDVGLRVNGVYVTESMVGQKYGTPSVIETVTFSADGTKAYSDKKSGNIYKDGIIDAAFFTYNAGNERVTLSNGRVISPESFIWYLGTLSEDEIRLTYNVYLEDSMQGGCAAGSYATNTEAKLHYIDYEGTQREKIYPVPYLKWGEAKVAYELYLVDINGNPVDLNGNPVSFENRVLMSELKEVKQNLNTEFVADYDLLKSIVPDGYLLYNEGATYKVYMGSGDNGEAKVNDKTNTTIVFNPEDAKTDANGNVKADEYTDTKVAFGVVLIKIDPIVVVLDYGKSILAYPLEDNLNGFSINGITAEAPREGLKTSKTVTLKNGVATYYNGEETVLPKGNVVASLKTDSTTFFYPSSSDISSANNTRLERYCLKNGAVSKYAANSTEATVLSAGLSNEGYVTDNGYAFYNTDGTIYVVTEYNETVVAKSQTETYTYGELSGITNTITSTATAVGSTSSKTEMFSLPDGSIIYANCAGYRVSGYGDFYYMYIYDSSVEGTALTMKMTTSGSFKHTLQGVTDKDGNPIVITVNIERPSAAYGTTDARKLSSVTYTGYDIKTGTRQIGDDIKNLEMRTVSGDYILYSPFKYMDSIDKVYFYVSRGDLGNTDDTMNRLYSTATFIPATTVYYEDDFGGSAENGGLYIKYTGAWSQIDDNGNKAVLTTNTDTTDVQDRGEVGDGHVPYGYDSSYKDCVKFSNGTASVVQGTISKDANGKNQFDAYAEFTFTGTGFDIISRTDLDCGTITVAIYDSYDELVANVPVINKGIENLYQIPIISCDNLPYDTYTVKINVNAPQKYLGITGSTFYLDAIRIYNPMGLSTKDNSEFSQAYAAYYKDKESNAFIGSIRDYILTIGELGVDEVSGAVYVDTIDNDYSEGGVIDQEQIQEFHISGPNEEVYLTPGKGIGFALVCSALPSSVQLEIKIPTPLSNEAKLLVQTNAKAETMKEVTVNSSAEMFYDITEAVQFEQVQKASGTYYRAVVVLSNGLINADDNDIVSITNVKLTYPESVRNVIEAKDEDIIITSGVESTVIDEEGNIVETPTQVAVGMMASWNIYCDVFDTVYAQHRSTLPTYDVKAAQTAFEAPFGKAVTATFTTSQFVDELLITDADGMQVDADVKAVLNEDLVYSNNSESAKTWTVTFNNAVGEYNYKVSAANGKGETVNLSISVKPAEIVSISVYSAPDKTKYTLGEEISTDGLELLVTYSDGSTQVVNSGYTVNTFKAEKSGTRSVTVSYGGQETSFKINVKVNLVQLILSLFGLGWLWK